MSNPTHKNAFDLLTKAPAPEDTVLCQGCGERLPKSTKFCPSCGEPPILPTLAELGNKLPVGIVKEVRNEATKVVESKLLKDFEVSKLDFKAERKISAAWTLMQKSGNVNPLDYIVCVLSHTVERLAGQNFQKLDHDQRMLVLNQMWVGDVLYLYAHVRIVTLGEEFSIKNIQCPRCGESIERYPVDLGTLEVAIRPDEESLYKWIKLRDGFEMDGETRKKIKMSPATFYSLSHGGTSGDQAAMFAELMKNCVVEIEGVPSGFLLTDKEIDQLSGYDYVYLKEQSDYVSGGPKWEVDVSCSRCNFKWTEYIDWMYGNFFSLSSQSKRHLRKQ